MVPIILGLVVMAIIAYVSYMTVLHPLARYPGPFMAKLTNWYPVWHAFRGTRSSYLFCLHQEHGEFVRWGPNIISVNNATALQSIYGVKANTQKSSFYTVFFGISIFNAIDKNVHARKKRVMSYAFSEHAIRKSQPYIISASQDWLAALGDSSQPGDAPLNNDQWSSPKDMRIWAGYTIFDSLGELLFGQSFKTSFSPKNRKFLAMIPSAAKFSNIVGQMPILSKFHIDKMFVHRQNTRQDFVAFCVGNLKKRLALRPDSDSNGRTDIIHYLQQAKDPNTGEGYSPMELIHETVLLSGAGVDTTHTALTSTLYFLVHHPDVLKRLTTSLRRDFSSLDAIESGPILTANAYLRACVDEGLRLCPPLAMMLPREVCTGGLEVSGHHFGQGTVIGVPTYALHHSSDNFERPLEYDPARWIVKGELSDVQGNDPELVARQRQAFVPFSIGPRMCIAKNSALLTLYLNIARLLYTYDIRMAPGTEHVGVGPRGEYKVRDFFTVSREGPVLQFRPAKAGRV